MEMAKPAPFPPLNHQGCVSSRVGWSNGSPTIVNIHKTFNEIKTGALQIQIVGYFGDTLEKTRATAVGESHNAYLILFLSCLSLKTRVQLHIVLILQTHRAGTRARCLMSLTREDAPKTIPLWWP